MAGINTKNTNSLSLDQAELIRLRQDLNNLNGRVDKLETEINNKLKQIEDKQKDLSNDVKNGNDKIVEKLDKMKEESAYAKGFIKSIFMICAGMGVILTIIVKFIK